MGKLSYGGSGSGAGVLDDRLAGLAEQFDAA
jgi:hypothetical protein